MKNMLSLILLLILFGCQTTSKKINSDLEKQMKKEGKDASSYCWSLMKDKTIDPIRNKVAIKRSDLTFEMRVNKSMPTLIEKKAIAVYADTRKKCNDRFNQFDKKFTPPLNPGFRSITNTTEAKTQKSLASLYLGEITYGELTVQRNKIDQEHSSNKIELIKAIEKGAEEARYRQNILNIEQQKANAASQQAWNKIFEKNINNTNCSTSGNVTQFGNSANFTSNTNCY